MESLASLIWIEHASNGPELGEGCHTRQQLRTVLKQYANRIAVLHPMPSQYVRDAIRPGIEIPVIPDLSFEQQTVLARLIPCLVFKKFANRLLAVGLQGMEFECRPKDFPG